jgi:ssDNA-binding replication factor A large subunit
VYVKVLKTENSKVGVADRNVIYCTVGDQTGQARASFLEPPADLLKVGNVIAIRNGRSQVVKEQIELRIDV